MSREVSYVRILQSVAQMQVSIASMLEAKAAEAEKSKAWICSHLTAQQFATHQDQVQQPLEVHDGLIELIEAITRMEQSLGKHLQIVIGEQENQGGGGMGDFSDLLGGGNK
ncbi:hypothetical protein PC41400_24985 [Paenibacillus chitinolyticus]|uniref:Restriction endonuclease subunit S n=1 Tax=Paenibacillus chitinolyticus TaxID=79263 RepID=A0A410X2C9_9BACL|nr:hypothetical protein [Paenibacillus chitinolyticus]MCY9593591.1 hypothetical protein [Paenibacillus chitinolyticus]MCY9597562.1 hypothetical protein [Paenibacillus chitinolyticus]QAV20759.1 hypothetical protein PC41400_24985 [Paenibacillus chitinolyticus]